MQSHTHCAWPCICKNKIFNNGVYREDITDVQLQYQLYLAKMGSIEGWFKTLQPYCVCLSNLQYVALDSHGGVVA